MKQIMLGETTLPAIGQGTWYMGEQRAQQQQEIAALQAGLEQGLKLIDTAEMYAEGEAEKVVGHALQGRRDSAFLVSKFYPWHAGKQEVITACEQSLQRLQTDYLDLYLLHWRGSVPFAETLGALEQLKKQGKIKHWGVSNFDVEDLALLHQEPGGAACATNQVLYHLASRGIEFDLLPYCQQHTLPIMAYCPLAQAGRLRHQLFENARLQQLAQQRGISVAQLLLAWVIRDRGVMAIPKSSSIKHVQENARALQIELSDAELTQMDEVFPPPSAKMALDVV